MRTTIFALFILGSSSVTEGFAPRPGCSLRQSTRQRSLRRPTSESWSLNASTLQDVDHVELTSARSSDSDLPFYAKPANDVLSATTYQQQLLQTRSQDAAILAREPQQDKQHKLAEFAPAATMITALSTFLLVNNFVGPWPAALLSAIPVKAFGLTHALAGMLFGGGIILTTLVEWLATESNNPTVLQFYFDKVPKLDALVVLPALSASIVSGVGLAVDHYGSLADSPFHVVGAISTLLAFAIWWAVTDVTTQGAAMEAIQEWVATTTAIAADNDGHPTAVEVPQIVKLRKISNVVSCLFVAALYGFMVLKPGFAPPV